jgi:ParB/RepB/Spo0J family partition protein
MTIKIANKFDLWSVDDLVPYERNSRLHPEDQVAGIAASIREFGFIAPIVVDTSRNRIAAGHGRLMAARLLGMARVPVVAVDHLTEQQFRAYVIADNKHTDNSRFDEEVLAAEVAARRALAPAPEPRAAAPAVAAVGIMLAGRPFLEAANDDDFSARRRA